MSNFYHPHFLSFEKAHIWNFDSVANLDENYLAFEMDFVTSSSQAKVGDTEYQDGLRLQDTNEEKSA